MQSKRKPYFAGSTVPLKGEGGGILYNRYTDPAAVLLEPSADTQPASVEKKEKKEKKRKAEKEAAPAAAAAPAEAPAGGDAPAAPKERKKPRWSEDKKAAAKAEREAAKAATGGDAGAPDAKPAKKKDEKKKEKDAPLAVRKLAPEEKISGPSNAEEAEKIRQTLGFVPAPDAPAPPTGGFSFRFAGGAGNGTAAPAPKASSDSDDSSSSDSESDSEDDKAPPAAAPAKKDSSSDDSSDSDSGKSTSSSSDSDSDSDDSSSSDSDSDAPAAKPAPAAQQQYHQAPAAPVTTTTTTTTTTTAAPGASPMDSEYVPRRIYAGGMPYGFTEAQVREYWEYCGPIESLDLLTFPDTGRFRGIAFITFATEEGYTAALACDGEACEGQTVKVQRCKWSAKDRRAAAMAAGQGGAAPVAPPTAPAPTYAAVAPPTAPAAAAAAAVAVSTTLRAPAPKTTGYDVAYVGNIAYEADEAAVRALFEPYGVTKVRIHTDKDTGRPKGYAHVHFKDEAGLDGALALDGTPLMGRRIRVGYAQPKKEAPAQG